MQIKMRIKRGLKTNEISFKKHIKWWLNGIPGQNLGYDNIIIKLKWCDILNSINVLSRIVFTQGQLVPWIKVNLVSVNLSCTF